MTASSPFLTLPGEIRNSIYEYYTAGIRSLGINRDGSSSPPPLMQTCRQVRKEMHKLVEQDIGLTVDFEAVVLNYNFGHVLRFFERLRPIKKGLRNLKITVKLTSNCVGQHERDGAKEWLTQVEDQDNPSGDPTTKDNPLTYVGGHRLHVFYSSGTPKAKARAMFYCGCTKELHDYFDTYVRRDSNGKQLLYLDDWTEQALKRMIQPCWSAINLPRKQRLTESSKEELRPRISVNHAAFRGISKDRRPHSKSRRVGPCVLPERHVPTMFPRAASEGLMRWRSKRRASGENGTSAKMTRTLSLRDRGTAHWVERDWSELTWHEDDRVWWIPTRRRCLFRRTTHTPSVLDDHFAAERRRRLFPA